MINKSEIELLRGALETLEAGSAGLPEFTPQFDVDAVAEVLNSVAERMQDNFPYFHPQYAGQMLKPPHPVARLAYALSLWVNPNNHALAGGGTMANLEALWVAGRLHSGKKILASTMSHYTHSRISEVLGLPYGGVATDASGRMDVAALEAALEKGDVGTVVATIGTTGLGTVDPLPEILALRERHDFRIHADAAYGGYFGLASEIDDATRQAIGALHEVDSIVIDPHKHGLQPYGCGCILFRDPSVGRFYQHDSPYTYFSSGDLHLGEITLECSRPGASAVALWATHRLLPLQQDGEFAAGLDSCLRAARAFWHQLDQSPLFTPLVDPQLDIVVYAVNAATASEASRKAREVFASAARNELHLALIELPVSFVRPYAPHIEADADTMTCLRSAMMKPEHEDWVDRITALLEVSAGS